MPRASPKPQELHKIERRLEALKTDMEAHIKKTNIERWIFMITILMALATFMAVLINIVKK